MIEIVNGDRASRILLERIGIENRPRGLDYVRELALHFSEFPYENISKIIRSSGAADPLEAMRMPTEVVCDHYDKGFGGTCFSLTFLLERVLRAIGFDCYKVMADMNSGPNVHCLVVVKEAGSRYMIDPGYALYEVIELPGGGHSRTRCPHAVVEIERDGTGAFNLWTLDSVGRKWRYAFRDEPVGDQDFERFWIESFTKPTLNNICLTRMTPAGHIYLRKDFFKFTSRESISKRRLHEGVESLIETEFGISGEWTRVAQKILKGRRNRSWQK